MYKINFKNKKGFTIIETLVAVTILMISIVGPLTIAQKSLMASIYARDQVTASFLAQDMIEKIKNDKSNALLLNTVFSNWVSTYVNPCAQNNSVGILRIQSDGTLSTSGTNTPSKFSCTVRIEMLPSSSSEAKAIVTISWTTGTLQNSVILQDNLFDVVI
jgi:Tfp pilus assembly protein PilV